MGGRHLTGAARIHPTAHTTCGGDPGRTRAQRSGNGCGRADIRGWGDEGAPRVCRHGTAGPGNSRGVHDARPMMQKHTARTAVVAQPERKARRVSARVLACRPPSCFSASAVHIDWLIETSSGLGMNPAGATTNNIVAIEDPARVAQRAPLDARQDHDSGRQRGDDTKEHQDAVGGVEPSIAAAQQHAPVVTSKSVPTMDTLSAVPVTATKIPAVAGGTDDRRSQRFSGNGATEAARPSGSCTTVPGSASVRCTDASATGAPSRGENAALVT
jgi:hypothetical protein